MTPDGKTPTEVSDMPSMLKINGKDWSEASLADISSHIRWFMAEKLWWRARVLVIAIIVGLLCGIVAALYEMVMDFVLELVWMEGGDLFQEKLPSVPAWLFILLVCPVLGALVGALIRLLGEPMANLPGVVMAAHRDGLLGHEEAPAMAAISIVSITGAGSLGPEAPLVSIGGGLASLVSIVIDLSEAETLFVTMCGMGAGLAAFFGEPVGGALFACEVIHRYGLEYYEAVIPTVVAGLSCNWSFRVLANLPQKPIWTYDVEEALLPWTSILGLLYGAVGGYLGWAWMRCTNLTREKVLVPYKLGPRHILKGFLGGLIIGSIGVLFPETLFWAEHESQTIISHGAVPLPHANPSVGLFGPYSLSNPFILIAIGLFKLVAIMVTVLAGYRGGFIFPFMFAGHSIGMGLALLSGGFLSPGAASLCVACAINVAVTRTVIATPIVMSSLSGRVDVFPTLLVSSLVAIYITGEESIIKAARGRLLRHELDGAEQLVDGDAPMNRRRSRVRTPTGTPGSSAHGGNTWADAQANGKGTAATGGAANGATAEKVLFSPGVENGAIAAPPPSAVAAAPAAEAPVAAAPAAESTTTKAGPEML